jgi:hypothetical protein
MPLLPSPAIQKSLPARPGPAGGTNDLISQLNQQRQQRLNDYLNPTQAYDLQPSPTHAYLEEFDSIASTPDIDHRPNFGTAGTGYGGIGLGSPMSPARGFSPGMSSPGLDTTEKDPLGGGFGANQYSSNHFLAPTQYPVNNQVRRGSEKSYSRSDKRGGCLPTNPTKRKWLFIGVPVILVLVAAGAGVGAYFATKKPAAAKSGSGGASGGTASDAPVNFGVAGTGKTGSVVTTDLGVTYTYTNPFDGSWAQNPQNPYSVSPKHLSNRTES